MQLGQLSFLHRRGKIRAGVCHGCGRRFIVPPGVDDQEEVRRAILNEVVGHECEPRSQGREQELLDKLKWLLAKEGRLSQRLVKSTRGMPSLPTFRHHFGTFRRIYKLIGYRPNAGVFDRAARRKHTYRLRSELFDRLKVLFPGRVSVLLPRGKVRPVLQLDSRITIAVSICRARRSKDGQLRWLSYQLPEEEWEHVLLLCLLDETNKTLLRYYVLPNAKISKHRHLVEENDQFLASGIRLDHLSQLCAVVSSMVRSHSSYEAKVANPQVRHRFGTSDRMTA